MSFDSKEVLSLKARLNAPIMNDGSDWAEHHRRLLRKEIRRQRLEEARARGTHTAIEWAEILDRFNGRCVRCGCYPEPRPCKDHITPIYMGGSDAADNLQPLCRQCNTAKGSDAFNWAAYRESHGFTEEGKE